MTTNIPITHPVLAELRQRVEQQLGLTIDSQQSIHLLEEALNFTINADTLRRIWGFRHDTYSTVRRATVDHLARFVGSLDWTTFVAEVQAAKAPESKLTVSHHQVCADKLQVGELVEISWLPDRLCRLRYLGDMRWQVVEVIHSTTLAMDDTFSCRVMAVGQELIVDNVTHLGQHFDALHLGKDHGLTTVRKL